ncbi:MAG: hypothetical protein ACRD2K_02565 [Terriglobales bacterium]
MTSAGPIQKAHEFAPLSARRLLVLGGIALIAAGIVLGDLFAVFSLHQNAGRIGEHLTAAVDAVAAENPQAAREDFAAIGGRLENRGTKVDAHAHIIAFGYLALLLALAQPYFELSDRSRRRLAQLYLAGAVLLPVSVFLIHYVGLKYSPLASIGWASIAADFGGLLVIVACAGFLAGLARHLRSGRSADDPLLRDRSRSAPTLLAGGTLLILAGFLHGAYYAAVDLAEHEARESRILTAMVERAAQKDVPAAHQAVQDYGMLQAEKAVAIAAHSHLIEFGLLAVLMAFLQPYVMLSERWKERWAAVLLAGSVILPVFVLAELRLGLVAGGVADAGGLLVIIALVGMLAGVVRYTGKLDAGEGAR